MEARLHTEAGPETVAGYDEVIVATGAKARKLALPGLEDPRVMEAIEYLRGGKEAGERVVVIGGGLTGVEIAYDLALKGKKPVIVEMQRDILLVPGLCASNSNMLREIIRYYDIPVYVNTTLAGVSADGGFRVRVKEQGAAEETLLEADSCILSVGYVPSRQLADELTALGYPPERLHVIGDAHRVENLMNVIWESYELCYKL